MTLVMVGFESDETEPQEAVVIGKPVYSVPSEAMRKLYPNGPHECPRCGEFGPGPGYCPCEQPPGL